MADSAGLSYFVWDGLNPVAVTDAAGNVKYEYTYGASAVDGVGNLLETREVISGNIKVPAFNHRGDVAGTTDAAGIVKDTYLYDAFGKEISSTTSGFYNPFQYQSNWLTLKDAPANFPLLLSPSRVYAPGLGIFLSRDPKWDTTNLYQYLAGNPIRYVDPTGEGISDVIKNLWNDPGKTGDYLQKKYTKKANDIKKAAVKKIDAVQKRVGKAIINVLPDEAKAAVNILNTLPPEARRELLKKTGGALVDKFVEDATTVAGDTLDAVSGVTRDYFDVQAAIDFYSTGIRPIDQENRFSSDNPGDWNLFDTYAHVVTPGSAFHDEALRGFKEGQTCYLKCLKDMNKKGAAAILGTLGGGTLAGGAVGLTEYAYLPKLLLKLEGLPTYASWAEVLGVSSSKVSPFTNLMRARASFAARQGNMKAYDALRKLATNFKNLAKSNPAAARKIVKGSVKRGLVRGARLGVGAVALAEIAIASYCSKKCSDDPCFDATK